VIRDNLDMGPPDKVSIVFGRTIRQRCKFRPGDLPHPGHHERHLPLPLPILEEDPGQVVPEGRRLRTETTVNQPRDLGIGIGKELTNLAAMAKAGYGANRRLLDTECIKPRPGRRNRRPR
jgi:hypothetical protein